MASAEIKTTAEGIYLSLFCDSCDDDGRTNIARSFCFDCEKSFCSDCEKLHSKFAGNHKTIAGDDLPEAKELDPHMQCGSHAKHSVEFYCEEHQSVFCRLCKHIKHGDCEVKDFGTVCQEFDLETEFNKAVENVRNVTGQITEAKYRGIRQLERLEEEAEERKSFIRNFRSDLDKLFDRYENAGDHYVRANMERENAVLESVDVYLKQAEEEMRLLEETKGQLEENAVFAFVIKLNQLCKEYISKVKDIVADAKEHKPFSFHDDNISALLEKFSIISCAEQPENTSSDEAGQGEATSGTLKKSFWNIKGCMLISDSVVTTGDGMRIDITACLTMVNGEVILCDSANQRMMMMNKCLKFLVDINFQFSPFDIAEVDENTVAVSIPIKQIVQFVAIKPGLKLKTELAVGQECYGIAFHEKKMYLCVTYKWDGGVNVYSIQMRCTLRHTLLRSINIATNATPHYISPGSDGTNIFLSGGNGKEPVVCISKEGHVIYKYFDDTFQSPRNVFVDDEDNVLLGYAMTSYGNKTGLRVIKSGGECSKHLPLQEENLGKITALHFDKRSDMLLVASEHAVEAKTVPKSSVSKLRMFKLEY